MLEEERGCRCLSLSHRSGSADRGHGGKDGGGDVRAKPQLARRRGDVSSTRVRDVQRGNAFSVRPRRCRGIAMGKKLEKGNVRLT